MTRLLDDIFVIPGTNIGVGLDGLLGLIPGIGDATTTVMGGAIMVDAMRNRFPMVTLARMATNLGIDALLSFIPLVGDAADFAHRANRKNIRLLEQVIADRETSRRKSKTYFIGAAAIIVLTIVVLVTLLILGIVAIWRALFG